MTADSDKILTVGALQLVVMFVALATIGFPVYSPAEASIPPDVNTRTCQSITESAERLLCYDRLYGNIKNQSNPGRDDEPEKPVEVTQGAPGDSFLEERLKKEEILNYNQFAITPHRPNYILPLTYNNNPNTTLYDNLVPDDKLAGNLDKHELKFQLSFKIPLVREFLFKESSLWFAYSQVAFWQMYNLKVSAPFRETNYEPELIWVNKTGIDVFGFRNSLVTLALNHQSNGQAKPLSRSWNRIVADFILEKDNTILSFRPWYRIPENSEDDGNPDIHKYLGHAEFSALYKYKEHLSTIMLRNNMRSDNRTTAELTYTFRFSDRFKGIAQYFNGYGESLIDYNHRVRRIGVGILITDWL